MEKEKDHNYRLSSLILGFILSLICLLVAYFVSTSSLIHLPKKQIVFLIVGITIVQLIGQLFFFSPCQKETNSPSNCVLLISSLLLIAIVIWGTLWIMFHLNLNLMPWMEQMERNRGL